MRRFRHERPDVISGICRSLFAVSRWCRHSADLEPSRGGATSTVLSGANRTIFPLLWSDRRTGLCSKVNIDVLLKEIEQAT